MKTGKKRVNIISFKNNIEKLISMCQRHKLIKEVIFLWVTGVDENTINQVDSLWADHYFYNSEIQKYNNIIQEWAKNNNCSYIDVFWLMQENDLEDGLHPNSRWHQKIYEKVLEYLEK
jgi:lysophospholipase L1-like esterase